MFKIERDDTELIVGRQPQLSGARIRHSNRAELLAILPLRAVLLADERAGNDALLLLFLGMTRVPRHRMETCKALPLITQTCGAFDAVAAAAAVVADRKLIASIDKGGEMAVDPRSEADIDIHIPGM